ncbi:MAG TPA: CbtA family protein [Nocardioidaceae bacterium]|nr:CbtA family protein [Nocardioidaceae bacterium]
MTARAFLVRGLLAGLLAGFAVFIVAFTAGEPHVQAAIDVEEANSAAEAPAAEGAEPGHHDEEDGTVVSRHNQRTWGLLTGSLGIGTALGGIVALVAAGLVGRIGRWSPGQSTAFVALAGFVTVGLVPFLKYPASPPAVGNPDTIGSRTGEYFAYMLISVLAAAAATVLAQRLWREGGAYVAVVASVSLYLMVVVVAGQLMPTVNEIGDFPADTLWYFRRASIITQATMWAGIGVLLVGMVDKLHRETTATTERRKLAATL